MPDVSAAGINQLQMVYADDATPAGIVTPSAFAFPFENYPASSRTKESVTTNFN